MRNLGEMTSGKTRPTLVGSKLFQFEIFQPLLRSELSRFELKGFPTLCHPALGPRGPDFLTVEQVHLQQNLQ